jgi:acyl transferase domain-containing protein
MSPSALAVAKVDAHGLPVDWSADTAQLAPARVRLPTYPFQRRRYPAPEPGAATPPVVSPAEAQPLPERTEPDVAKAQEPIAIVGIGCRFPGGANCPDELWDLVAGGIDATGPFPTDRGWPSGLGGNGGFLADPSGFDAEFFGISPREALAMDPQQRLLLECAWEALEHAGIDPTSLCGTPTAVYTGLYGQDYGPRAEQNDDRAAGYVLTGTIGGVASGRLAYHLGTRGPAITVDTAQSSSLVAIHLAVRELRHGGCSLALAGGVTVMATHGMFVELSRLGGLAPDGRCKPFASAADGTTWAEGAAVLVLEPLAEANRLGHRVLAVIRGSAVNSDGASNGLTAPNGPAQELVIRQALADAGLAPSDVDAVEAHGTGTQLGDPIEALALQAVYGRGRPAGRPLWIGSIKSNLGHPQAAAGVAGVVKMVMALRHGELPATLNVDAPTPRVDWTQGVRLLTNLQPWPDSGPRRAGVSAFGISGTNAHLILEQAPSQEIGEGDEITPPLGGRAPAFVPLAAASGAALGDLARRLHGGLDHLDETPSVIGRALATGRAMPRHRAVVLAGERAELAAGLEALAAGTRTGSVVVGTVPARGPGKTVFVFPGQGGQYPGMAGGLYRSSPVFREHIDECARLLDPLTGCSLVTLLTQPEETGWLARVEVVQPALFAIMVALARLWRSLGVHPDAVVGHSQGEVAAAHVSGALSLPDAATVITSRSRLLTRLHGAMATIALPADEIIRLDTWTDELTVAAVNSPETTVVSGTDAAVDRLVAACERDGARARRIPVSYAAHSPSVDVLAEPLAHALAGVRASTPDIPFYSSVTGRRLGAEPLDARYWFRNLREPVRFQQAAEAITDDGHRVFVEAGAHPVLTAAVAETCHPRDVAVLAVGTLRRDHDDTRELLTSTARLHTHGVSPDWHALFAGVPARTVDLPRYPFQHTRFWLSPAESAPRGHPFLGTAVDLPDGGMVWTGQVDLGSRPWLTDHVVNGMVLFPGSGFADLAAHTGVRSGSPHVAELILRAPLAPSPGPTAVHAAVSAPDQRGRRRLTIHSRPAEGAWVENATGTLGPGIPPETDGWALRWPPPGAEPVDLDWFGQQQIVAGYRYGGAFRGLRALWRHGEAVFVEVEPPESRTGFAVDPTLLDAALQAHLVCSGGEAGLPFTFTGFSVWQASPATARVRLRRVQAASYAVELAAPDGAPIAAATAITFRPVLAPARLAIDGECGAPTPPAPSPGEIASPLRDRIAGLGEADRENLVLDLVLTCTATVLGHGRLKAVDPDLPFKTQGMDSPTAVELRNELATASGSRLSPTVVFDHPDPRTLARHLVRLLAPRPREPDKVDHFTDEELFRVLDQELGAR